MTAQRTRRSCAELSLKIVEAYLGAHDLASHSSRDRTPRTPTMFGPPGYAYVSLIYGHCLNEVTEPEGHGSSVLIRAVEPTSNINGNTRGPGRLCRALHLDRRLNGHNLLSADLLISPAPEPAPFRIVHTPRVGMDRSGEWAKAEL
ncbi:DNA-3-methyladenine glycosylase (plasmid) [Deinococcus sp. KNUC1210]|nr:DNA-3-methyladenine glycosylase [Deinococcus sp. KNUC1210]ULH17654.1 DNA-3-methyladenine glycosylase [Deinococcus sp. KNUC1210]